MYRKIDNMSSKRQLDQDEITDAMNQDVSQCCGNKKKSSDSKRRRTVTADDSDDPEDINWSKKKKKKKKISSIIDDDSNSGTESVDSELSAKRSRKANKSVSETVPDSPAPSAPKKSTPPQQAKKTPMVTPAEKPTTNIRKLPQPVKVPLPNNIAIPPPTVPNTDAAEIDCTPDLFAYLANWGNETASGSEQSNENSVSSSTQVTSTAQAPSTSPKQLQPLTNSNAMRIDNVASGQAASAEFLQPNQREQFVRRVARSQANLNSTQPVYHNYNGYRIDLNSASQQSTIRLPNGKVIHVKKQSPINRNEAARFSITPQPSQPGAASTPRTVIASIPPPSRPQPQPQIIPRTIVAPPQPQPRPQPHIIQRVPTSTAAAAPMGPRSRYPNQAVPPRVNQALRQPIPQQPRSQAPLPPPLVINSVSSGVPMPTYSAPPSQRARGPRGPMVAPNHMPMQQAQMQFQQMLQGQRMPPTNAMPPAQIPNVSAGPSAPTAMMPRIYSNDPVGRARTQMERQIFNAISICHQIDGKLKTLMNSNAYKDVEKLHDIKELYIHLSYLFTYTNGRFQSVHDKCMEDMRRLGFKNDAISLKEGNVIDKYGSDVDEDDLEIVEPDHQTINLDSDDERTPEKSKSKSNTSTPRPRVAPPEITQSNNNDTHEEVDIGVMLDITSSTENLECDVDVSAMLQINMNIDDDDNGESLLSRMNDGVGEIATPPDSERNDELAINIENDLKLKSKATISLEPVEKVYPDLMERALQKMKATQAEDEQKPDDNDDEEELEQPPEIDSPDQSQEEGDAEGNAIEKGNENITSDSTNEKKDEEPGDDSVEIVHDVDEEKQSENEPIEVPNTESAENIDNEVESVNKDGEKDEIEVESNGNDVENTENVSDKVVSLAENEAEHAQIANEHEEVVRLHEDIETENIGNEVEIPQIEEAEAVKLQEDADFVGNEAKSVDNDSGSDDKETSNQESHAEITSTSTVIENDIEMIDIAVVEETVDGSKGDVEMEHSVNDPNEVSLMDTVDDSIIEIDTTIENDQVIEDSVVEIETTQEPNETESIFSDLSDCNQLNEITNEISNEINEISTEIEATIASAIESEAVQAILANDDFENISSPDTFN